MKVKLTNTAVDDETVTIESIPDGHRFRISLIAFAPGTRRIVVTGWTYGTKLFHNSSRARVRLTGESRHVIFGDGDQSKRREFDAAGSAEINYPCGIEVVAVTEDEYAHATSTSICTNKRSGGATTMTTETVIDPKAVKAAVAKFRFLTSSLAKADTPEAKEVASKKIATLTASAKELGFDVKAEAKKDDATSVVDNPSGAQPAKVTPAKVVTNGKVKEQTVTKPATLKEQNAARKATLAAKKASEPKAEKVKVTKADRVLAKTHDCLCGCGTETGGKFAPGHDARVKGQIMRVERGEEEVAALPEAIQPYVKFAGKRADAGKDTGSYRLTHSPIKIPGRPEVTVIEVTFA